MKINGSTPAIRAQQRIERAIVHQLIRALLADGYRLQVWYAADDPATATTQTARAVLAACGETDDEWLVAEKDEPRVRHWVRLVYGNDGPDVIADYHVGLETLMGPVNAYADRF